MSERIQLTTLSKSSNNLTLSKPFSICHKPPNLPPLLASLQISVSNIKHKEFSSGFIYIFIFCLQLSHFYFEHPFNICGFLNLLSFPPSFFFFLFHSLLFSPILSLSLNFSLSVSYFIQKQKSLLKLCTEIKLSILKQH